MLIVLKRDFCSLLESSGIIESVSKYLCEVVQLRNHWIGRLIFPM